MDYKITYELNEKDILMLKFELYEKSFEEIQNNPKYIKVKEKIDEMETTFEKSKIIYDFILKHHKAKWNKLEINRNIKIKQADIR